MAHRGDLHALRGADPRLPGPGRRRSPAREPTGVQRPAREPGAEQQSGVAAGPGVAAVFSGTSPASTGAASSAGDAAPASVPKARTDAPAASRRVGQRQWGKVGRWIVPAGLEPVDLRDELIDLGDAFRAYQARTQPDLAVLAALHERKARAFETWAAATGDHKLRQEGLRAGKAAAETHYQRTGQAASTASTGTATDTGVAVQARAEVGGPVVDRLLTAGQAAHARTVLDYAAAAAPGPDAGQRLAVLMLGLRAARAGTGNITGQDLTGWLADDAQQVLDHLVQAGWLQLPGTVAEVMASRPEDPTAFTVPSLLPDQASPFGFGKTTRSRISGWAQKVVGDRKLRKKKAGAADRLLALYTAAHTRPDGHLGHPRDNGLDLARAAVFCTLTVDQVAGHIEVLVAADWLTDTTLTGNRLSGKLTERVLPLGGLLQ
ncbi:hypothetical protein [Streptacidiphilus sp. PAMC 29251]